MTDLIMEDITTSADDGRRVLMAFPPPPKVVPCTFSVPEESRDDRGPNALAEVACFVAMIGTFAGFAYWLAVVFWPMGS